MPNILLAPYHCKCNKVRVSIKLSYNDEIYYYRKQTVVYNSFFLYLQTYRLIDKSHLFLCVLQYLHARFQYIYQPRKNIFVVTNAIKFFILALVIQEFCIFGFQVTKSCIRHNQRYSQSTNGNPTWDKNHETFRYIERIVFQATKAIHFL